MTTRRNYSNSASVGVILDVLNNTDLTDTVTLQTALTSWPATPCTATINIGQADEEVVLVTAISGTSVTITRGYDNTATRAHTTNATLTHSSVAKDFDEANAHTSATAGVHGIAGNVVGDTDTQTLSNKTIVRPTIADLSLATHDHSNAAHGNNIPQSSITGLTAALNAKAADNAVVHNSGTEIIAGDKTFSGAVTVNGNGNVGGTFHSTGVATLSSDATVGGNASVTGNLSVTGTVTRNGATLWGSDNLGRNTFSGTTDGSGNLVVTHGLGFTPAVVLVQLTSPSAGANQGLPVVTAITASTFTIRMLTLQGSTTGLGIAGFFVGVK